MQNKLKTITDKSFMYCSSIALSLMLNVNKVFAEGSSAIDASQVDSITNKMKEAVTSLAMPIGSILIFVCVVITALRIAINHNNPNKRSENLASIGWLVIAGLILGASLVIAGIIINITSQNGSLYGAMAVTNINSMGI